jgi:hypothetical protein
VSSLLHNRYVRRIAVAIVVLAVVDQWVPGLLARVERDRYESTQLFRFENSDLFSLGPVVQYFREHPKGTRPRVGFFGDSVVWGYFLKAQETVPAQFQRLEPSVRVFNLGINNLETGSAYLIAKSILPAIDFLYVFYNGDTPNAMLPQLIPVEASDLERFRLEPPDRFEPALERSMGFWQLYDKSYRLQAGLFGTSTRLYLYLHKADLARQLLGRPVSENPAPAEIPGVDAAMTLIGVDVSRAPTRPADERLQQLSTKYSLLWSFVELIGVHHKQAIIVELSGHSRPMPDQDRADLNALFFPNVTFLKLTVPVSLKIDTLHLSPLGSAAVATILARQSPGPGSAR